MTEWIDFTVYAILTFGLWFVLCCSDKVDGVLARHDAVETVLHVGNARRVGDDVEPVRADRVADLGGDIVGFHRRGLLLLATALVLGSVGLASVLDDDEVLPGGHRGVRIGDLRWQVIGDAAHDVVGREAPRQGHRRHVVERVGEVREQDRVRQLRQRSQAVLLRRLRARLRGGRTARVAR